MWNKYYIKHLISLQKIFNNYIKYLIYKNVSLKWSNFNVCMRVWSDIIWKLLFYIILNKTLNPLNQKLQIEIAEAGGRLYCVDGFTSTPCWLKTIDIAHDISTCNVKLTGAKEGVFLKTVRHIKTGESLQMWFTEEILLMLNIPFLLPINIRSKTKVADLKQIINY